MTLTLEETPYLELITVNPFNPIKDINALRGSKSFPDHAQNDSIIKYDTYYRRNTIFKVNPFNPLNPIELV